MKIVFYNALTKPVTETFGVSVISLALLSGGYLVLAVVTALQLFAVASSRPAAVPFWPHMRGPVSIVLLALTCSSVLLQSSIAGGFFLEAAAPLYSASVSYLLFLSAYHFFRLIQAVQPA